MAPITRRSLADLMMTTRRGGATNPLITAVQKSALMGLMPRKSTGIPTAVATAMTA